ncbi:MAG: hypothetical protein JO072_12040 [Parafilimonas sp.]|nr:hypothetical protein [Parafilimonas sp.]
MPWQRVSEKEAFNWNEKLKTTNASFTQYPYYVSSEYNSVFSKALYIKYTHHQNDIAFAAIIEIGMYPFKVGVIDGGPVLLASGVEIKQLYLELKEFARTISYMHLQIRPPLNSPFNDLLCADADFDNELRFPFHLKVEFDLNIYNKPEKELLAGFKLQCRRKIVLAGRVPYEFKKVDDDKTLDDIRQLFKKVSKTKGYGFLPFKVYEAIYKEGKKYNLCDFYTAYLDGELVNVIFIVKDAQSYYHYTSALHVTTYKPSESPPAKLHFFVMQDCFYNEHKTYYNISFGGSDNLIRFKDLFNPIEIEKPPYYTFVIKKRALKFLSAFSPKRAAYLRNIYKTFENFFD